MPDRGYKTWRAFGYDDVDARRLERIAEECVRSGAADDITTARRAIACVTWRPYADELVRNRRAVVDQLDAERDDERASVDLDERVRLPLIPPPPHGLGVPETRGGARGQRDRLARDIARDRSLTLADARSVIDDAVERELRAAVSARASRDRYCVACGSRDQWIETCPGRGASKSLAMRGYTDRKSVV